MGKIKEEVSIESLVDVNSLFNQTKLDENEPFKFPKDSLTNFGNILASTNRCPYCGREVNIKDRKSILDHKIFHTKVYSFCNSRGAYSNIDEVQSTKKKARDIMYDKNKTLYSREYAVFFYLLAIYSKHVLSCIKWDMRPVENSKKYIKEYVEVNPEDFPDDLISYIKNTYCRGVK